MEPEDARRIREWARWLPLHDPLSWHVDQLVAGEPIPAGAVTLAFERLKAPGGCNPQTLILSALAVLDVDLPQETRAIALRSLRSLAERREPPDRHEEVAGLAPGCAASVMLSAACVAVWAMAGANPAAGDALYPLATFLGVMGTLAPLLGVGAGLLLAPRGTRDVRASAIWALGHVGDVASVDVVAAASCDPRRGVREAGERALARMLPALRDDHYGAVNPQVVPGLCRALLSYAGADGNRWPRRLRLAMPLLEALARMGDGRAVEAVQRVGFDSPDAALAARAREVLPVLQARHERERDAARLLRPAEAPAGGTLLRPAAAQAEGEPAALLRPVEGVETEP